MSDPNNNRFWSKARRSAIAAAMISAVLLFGIQAAEEIPNENLVEATKAALIFLSTSFATIFDSRKNLPK